LIGAGQHAAAYQQLLMLSGEVVNECFHEQHHWLTTIDEIEVTTFGYGKQLFIPIC